MSWEVGPLSVEVFILDSLSGRTTWVVATDREGNVVEDRAITDEELEQDRIRLRAPVRTGETQAISGQYEQVCEHPRHMAAKIRVHTVPPADYVSPASFMTKDGSHPANLGHTFSEVGLYAVRSCQVCGEPLEKTKLADKGE